MNVPQAEFQELQIKTGAGVLYARRDNVTGQLRIWAETHHGRPDDLLPDEKALMEKAVAALKDIAP